MKHIGEIPKDCLSLESLARIIWLHSAFRLPEGSELLSRHRRSQVTTGAPAQFSGRFMTPHEYLPKCRNFELKDRTASQSHFNDLCALLGLVEPIAADPIGEWFTFEKWASKTSGTQGAGLIVSDGRIARFLHLAAVDLKSSQQIISLGCWR